ncbi:helix-turn-helix transcriptional regulator [Salinilacihabitans rarus]|uniref:helix-turn-helix transcriptional regulator n=1 Tax=Salinilacihabitans rarus TaxID=2961596 RepID=UPI0020C8728B|nr:hypothetical protein [Salinilacihabitans rarus]
MRLPTAITFALTVLLITATLGAMAVPSSALPSTATGESPPRDPSLDTHPPALEPDDPRQVIRINVTDDGDAYWTVETRFRLETDADVDSFTEYADAVVAGDRSVGYDAETFERFVSEAERATGREMRIEDAGWDDSRVVRDTGADPEEDEVEVDDVEAEPAVGVVSYSFRWTDFATVSNNRIYFGDAFATGDGSGTWFPALADGQRLIVEAPPNYGFESAPPVDQQDGALVWDGPHEFGENELEIVYLRGANPAATLWAALSAALGFVPGGPAVGLFAILAVAGVGFLFARYGSPSEWPFDVPVVGGDGDETSTVTYAESDAAPDDSDREAESESVAPDEVDVELLSDEERVHRLLRRNGGRMKQAAIVKETGWSNAKVSQLLSKMDEDGQIEKLRIGRENLITLPEVDLTEID